MKISVTNDHGYALLVTTFRSFPHSWLITGIVIRVTQRMPQVEQELLICLEYLSSSPVFSGVRFTRSLAWCVCFVDRYVSLCPFFLWPLCCLSFDLRILITLSVSSNSSYHESEIKKCNIYCKHKKLIWYSHFFFNEIVLNNFYIVSGWIRGTES